MQSLLVEKSKFNRIVELAMPIIAGMVSQNVLNLIDTAMVGRLGANALAGVGISGMVIFLFFSPALGVTSAVQAIAARKKGEGKISETAFPLNTAMIYSFIFALIIVVIAFVFADPLFRAICEGEKVRFIAQDYFLIRVSATFFVVLNFAFRGYWNAVDMPKVYMKTLFTMHAINIVLNYCLIFGKFGFPKLEAQGAAIATAVSIVFGSLIYFLVAFQKTRQNGFLKEFPSSKRIWALTKISIPAGFELFITMTNTVAVFSLIGKSSTEELAGMNILMSIFLVTMLPAVGFGITLATLAGQALGAGNKEEAMNWSADINKVALAVFLFFALPCFFFPSFIMQIFTDDIQVIEVSRDALRLMGLSLAFEMIGFIYLDALKGLGDTKFVNIVSFVGQWLIFIPLVYVFLFWLQWSLFEIIALQVCLHLIQSFLLRNHWYKGNWLNIQVD